MSLRLFLQKSHGIENFLICARNLMSPLPVSWLFFLAQNLFSAIGWSFLFAQLNWLFVSSIKKMFRNHLRTFFYIVIIKWIINNYLPTHVSLKLITGKNYFPFCHRNKLSAWSRCFSFDVWHFFCHWWELKSLKRFIIFTNSSIIF